MRQRRRRWQVCPLLQHALEVAIERRERRGPRHAFVVHQLLHRRQRRRLLGRRAAILDGGEHARHVRRAALGEEAAELELGIGAGLDLPIDLEQHLVADEHRRVGLLELARPRHQRIFARDLFERAQRLRRELALLTDERGALLDRLHQPLGRVVGDAVDEEPLALAALVVHAQARHDGARRIALDAQRLVAGDERERHDIELGIALDVIDLEQDQLALPLWPVERHDVGDAAAFARARFAAEPAARDRSIRAGPRRARRARDRRRRASTAPAPRAAAARAWRRACAPPAGSSVNQ